MDLEYKLASVDVAAKDGVISGYASIFGMTDQGGDRVEPGAFTVSLARRAATGQRVKMLWQHDPGQPIGIWDEVAEDRRGLRVKGRLLDGVAKAQEARQLIEAGAIEGLSIGYRTLRAQKDSDGRRRLLELDIWEVSVVTFPMLSEAVIDEAKAAGLTRREIERVLTQDARFSRSVARKLMSGGIEALGLKQDADPSDLAELAALLRRRVK